MHELERPLSEAEISCVCCQMCAALEFIHNRNVIHRDLKAGNILVDVEGHAKLGIFHEHLIYTTVCPEKRGYTFFILSAA